MIKHNLTTTILFVLWSIPTGLFSQKQPVSSTTVQNNIQSALKILPEFKATILAKDWLLEKPEQQVKVYKNGSKEMVIDNGLVSRTFRLSPNAATVSLKNLTTAEEYIRAVKPEALVMVDSVEYAVGGLAGQREYGYLLEEYLDEMTVIENSFRLTTFKIKDISQRIEWKQTRWKAATQWDASGKEIIFYYENPALKGISIKVHHQIYDGIPLLSKWISVENESDHHIRLNHFTSEIIAHPEKTNFVDIPNRWRYPNLYLENDYAFGGMTYEESNQALSWETDPEYSSQVNWERKMPCVIKSKPKHGPQVDLKSGESFTSFRTYILPLDGTDRERNSLSIRKMYRTLAPWITENPIFLHLTSTDPTVVKTAIDQCAEVGYEMVILSFGSGLSMEDNSPENIKKFKTLADYAHNKGIQLGGYSLFSSRRIDDENDVVDIQTNKPGGAKFGGHAPCAGSEWGIAYIEKLKYFFEQTGFDILEHDGPYPGDFCASTSHPSHRDYDDSQWKQWSATVAFYKWLRAEGIYANMPDFYLLSGTSKSGIGYREVNWSLPRAQQIILGRQNIYDGTWTRTPSMGWTFVPLTQYHGGGAEATLEPLSEHLDSYDAHMTQNYGSGVQACYRGPRLYDTDETKKLVKSKIEHYKKYRDILNADIIHLRRPDGRDWDGILHVDPQLENKGYAMIYNPTKKSMLRTLRLPLYFTGLKDKAKVSINGGDFMKYDLDRFFNVMVEIEIPAEGHCWIVIR
jgi:hypothetical protein